MIRLLPKVQYLDTSDFNVKKITVAGNIDINYAEIGSGEIIIMIHGMANNWISLVPIANHLRSDYRVILIDLPGYGDSGLINNYSIANQARILVDFIKQLDTKPLAVVGFSMSGSVIAEAIRLNPEISNKAVILGPYISFVNKKRLSKLTYKFYQVTSRHNKFNKPIKKLIELRLTGYLAGKLLNMHRFNPSVIDSLSLIGRRKLKPGVYSQIGFSTMDYRLDQTFSQIRLPLLLIIGERDKVITPFQLREIVSKTNNNIKIEVVHDAGHALNMEAIEDCARLIALFCQ